MITFKQKEYVRQEAYQQLKEDQKILPDPELVSRYGECKLELEEHKILLSKWLNLRIRKKLNLS